MTKEYNYRDLCPDGGDAELFNRMICKLIHDWPKMKNEPSAWPTPKKVNDELDNLRKTIAELSDFTRNEIITRENKFNEESGSEWVYLNGSSALEKLEKFLTPTYVRWHRSDGQPKWQLGFMAFWWWHDAGGITYENKNGRASP